MRASLSIIKTIFYPRSGKCRKRERKINKESLFSWRARLAHRHLVPARRHRLRRQLLPEGRLGPQAARRQLRLPLPAAHLGDRGQRAPEAARHRQAQEAPRGPGGQARGAARPGVQARDRRHARGLEPRARGPPAGRGREVRAFDPVVDMASERLNGVRMCASSEEAIADADAAVLVTEWASIVQIDWAGLRSTMRSPVIIDGRNALDPREMTRYGLHLRGDRPHPRARGCDPLSQVVLLVGGTGTRLRPLTDTRPKPMMPLVDRPFVEHQIDLLRRHGIDDVIFSCGYRPDALRGALRRRLGHGHARALRGGPRAARHRRRHQERRGASRRRGRLRAERRHPHRPRPHGLRRGPPPQRGRGHRRPDPGGGPERLRARAPASGRIGGGVRREAAAGGAAPRRALPHQRRHLSAHPGRPRAHPGRPRVLHRARGVPGARRRGPAPRVSRATPTGATSGRPPPTWRPTTTSCGAPCSRRRRRATGTPAPGRASTPRRRSASSPASARAPSWPGRRCAAA